MDKTLFTITKTDGGAGVEIHVEEQEDFFSIAAALVSTFDECPLLLKFVNYLQDLLEKDEDFRKTVRENTISFPDFNKILKS